MMHTDLRGHEMFKLDFWSKIFGYVHAHTQYGSFNMKCRRTVSFLIFSIFFLFKVTTEEGIRSHRVELKVETPEAFILAEDEYHIERGSSLSLVCIIEKATEPPQ